MEWHFEAFHYGCIVSAIPLALVAFYVFEDTYLTKAMLAWATLNAIALLFY